MKNTYILTVAILVTTIFAACSGSKSRNIIALVDISNSIDTGVESWYIQSIEKDICAGLNQFDKLKILPIDGASELASTPLLELDLFECRKEWDKMGLNANETDKLKKAAFAKFMHNKMAELSANIVKAKAHRSSATGNTDIIGAICQACKSYDPKFSNYIIVLSDMEQYGGTVKMSEKGNADQWLKQSTSIRVKNVDKFTISMITGEQLDIEKRGYRQQIQSYWVAFFQKQGVPSAQVSYYSTDLEQMRKLLLASK